MEIIIGIAVLIVLLVIFLLISYVKAPPDTAYMISGFRKPRILIGKAGIRIPFYHAGDDADSGYGESALCSDQ